ncbi:MAG: HIT domain-containing protein [Anaerolineae bacterium]
MKYLVGEKPQGCIFCNKIAEDNDRENFVLYRGPKSCLMLNLYPYNSGHLMAIPYEHAPSLESLEEDTLLELMLLVRKSLTALRKLMNPDGFNVGVNIGKASGAGIDEHVHIHIVPRWEGDTNFMPVFAETRVVPELLHDTYDKLKAVL